jgi:hypothetical protein
MITCMGKSQNKAALPGKTESIREDRHVSRPDQAAWRTVIISLLDRSNRTGSRGISNHELDLGTGESVEE